MAIENCPFCGKEADYDATLCLEGIKDHVGCSNTDCPAYQFPGVHIDDWNKRLLKQRYSLRDIQKYILDVGIKLGFSSLTCIQRCLLLGEETGELFKSVRKHEGIPVDTKTSSIEDELSDVLLQTCAIANFYNIDLANAFRSKQEKDKKRQWKSTRN